MQALISYFLELCILRRIPQEGPAAPALLLVVMALDLLVGTLIGVAGGLHWSTSLAQGTTEVTLMLGALYLGLRHFQLTQRFTKVATALLGSGAVLGLFALAPMTLASPETAQSLTGTLASLALLALVIWSIVVTGHILRHAFTLTLGQGTALALAVEILIITLITMLFGGS